MKFLFFFICPEGEFYAISGTFEPPGGFPACFVLLSAPLDTSPWKVLYSLTIGGGKIGV